MSSYKPQDRAPQAAEAVLPRTGYGIGIDYNHDSLLGRATDYGIGLIDTFADYLDGLFQGYEIYFAKGRRRGGSQSDDHIKRSARGTHDKKRLKPGWTQQGKGTNPKRTRRKKPAPGSE